MNRSHIGSLLMGIRRVVQFAVDLVFPRRCLLCEKLLFRDEIDICDSCRINLPVTGRQCITNGSGFTFCVSPLFYTENVREAMLRFKFKGRWYYASTFGKYMAETVQKELFGRYDLVTWVPVSRRRLRKRGYDQARLLTEEICRELDTNCLRTLKKVHHTSAQSLVGGKAARQANVSGAYRVIDEKLVQGKRVLLVDDIITTGATLSECSRVLLNAGAMKVYCATACKDQLKL